eukprot:3489814-Rhodomonas_salina.1
MLPINSGWHWFAHSVMACASAVAAQADSPADLEAFDSPGQAEGLRLLQWGSAGGQSLSPSVMPLASHDDDDDDDDGQTTCNLKQSLAN